MNLRSDGASHHLVINMKPRRSKVAGPKNMKPIDQLQSSRPVSANRNFELQSMFCVSCGERAPTTAVLLWTSYIHNYEGFGNIFERNSSLVDLFSSLMRYVIIRGKINMRGMRAEPGV